MMRRCLLLLVYLAVWQERGRYTVYPFVFATARAHWVDFATETRLFWVYIYRSSQFFVISSSGSTPVDQSWPFTPKHA